MRKGRALFVLVVAVSLGVSALGIGLANTFGSSSLSSVDDRESDALMAAASSRDTILSSRTVSSSAGVRRAYVLESPDGSIRYGLILVGRTDDGRQGVIAAVYSVLGRLLLARVTLSPERTDENGSLDIFIDRGGDRPFFQEGESAAVDVGKFGYKSAAELLSEGSNYILGGS